MKSTFYVVSEAYWKKKHIQIANDRENKKILSTYLNFKTILLTFVVNISILKV